jgi:hypothetical protein
MKSPFPGMDPYLERHWGDVHPRLIYLACNEVNRQLGRDLRARMGERLVVEQNFDPVRSIHPDVRVFEHGVGDRAVSPVNPGVALAEPLVIRAGPIASEPARQSFIEIVDVTSGGRLITVVEFLSPANKLSRDGKQQYRQKQQEVLAADINMVEIDLTRAGARELLFPSARLPAEYQTTYLACVRRGLGGAQFEVYRLPLRERLPAIRIPLRPTDPDAVLDIQRLVDTAYNEGRYDDIDYTRPPTPPLEPDDAAWAAEQVRRRREGEAPSEPPHTQ